ncbi:MAG: hypothetical protein LBL13_04620 [Bacteroidales bacterium]|nr:hypothetical protein [Bacteroidales bacterium]
MIYNTENKDMDSVPATDSTTSPTAGIFGSCKAGTLLLARRSEDATKRRKFPFVALSKRLC